MPTSRSGSRAGSWARARTPRAKAQSDFHDRSKDPQGLDPKTTTFVTVTSRIWRDRDGWLKARRDEKTWADVRAFDADDIVTWLERALSVYLWISEQLGREPRDVRTPDAWWNRWISQTRVVLPRSFLLAGRDGVVTEIRDALGRHLAATVEHLRQRPAAGAAGAQVTQLVDDRCAGARPRSRRSGLPRPVGTRGSLHALLPQDRADRPGPAALTALLVDERADQRWRGPGSLAKKTEAAFRISLASRSSAFSFFSRLIPASSSLVGPLRCPVGLGLQHPLAQRLRTDPELRAQAPGLPPTQNRTHRIAPGPSGSRAPAARRDTCSA